MSNTPQGTQPDANLLALLTKLHEVARAIDFFEKRGENTHHKYNYVQAVDVVRRVREELLQRDIIVMPGATSAEHLEYSASGGRSAFLTTVSLTYSFVDVTSGMRIDVPWVGVGADIGGDKGVYKAFTGGLKYALQTVFLVPTTDDPEKDQLTESTPPTPAAQPAQHKDDARPAAPIIPQDRAVAILRKAVHVGMATLDGNAAPGTPPEFHPAFQAALALQGVNKIGQLNVDQAEAIETWLANEESQS